MNENDMDRYYWRTGQRWSGDNRPIRRQPGRRMFTSREIVLLAIAFAVTTVMLFFQR